MSSRTPHAIWETALGQLELQVTRPNFETWLRNTTGLALEHDRLIVGVPSDFAIEWLRSRLNGIVNRTVAQLLGADVQVAFQVLGAPAVPEPAAPSGGPVRPPAPELDPRLTFDAFTPVDSNRLAYRAARAVAKGSELKYHPLVLQGPPGLGKTHLLHAIGHQAVARDSHTTLLTGEAFVDSYVKAMRSDRPESFRARFDRCELFLLDDLRFLAGRSGSIDQFFHIFNDLHARGGQLVVTVDTRLDELADLPARLLSRLQAGLVAEIAPPSSDERLTIARKKATDLSDPLVRLIAEQPADNVRQVEGAINRLTAYADLHDSPLSTETALGALHPLQRRTALTPAAIVGLVAAHFELSVDQLTGRSRSRDITYARHIAMYLLRDHADLPLSTIGRLLGGRDHSTVLSGCRRIAREMKSLPQTRTAIQQLEARLASSAA